jgi:hypothetical protein
MLRDNSYAALKIFNILDWIGDGYEPYKDAMSACEFDYQGYVDRMKQYVGVSEPKKKKRKKK